MKIIDVIKSKFRKKINIKSKYTIQLLHQPINDMYIRINRLQKRVDEFDQHGKACKEKADERMLRVGNVQYLFSGVGLSIRNIECEYCDRKAMYQKGYPAPPYCWDCYSRFMDELKETRAVLSLCEKFFFDHIDEKDYLKSL